MKKLFYCLSLCAVLLTACSSDDENNNPGSQTVLLKKTIETDADGNAFTSVATYNGTKLDKISAGVFVIDFTYTGDLITRMDYLLNGSIIQQQLYSYNSNGKLIEHVLLETSFGYGSREMYVHNADGTISVTRYSGDETEQNDLEGTGIIYFENGEVSSIQTTYGVDYIYTYDNKNNPFKNVTGFKEISFADSSSTGIEHNILTEVSSSNGNTTNTYTYNSVGYPVTAETQDADGTSTTQFFYQ